MHSYQESPHRVPLHHYSQQLAPKESEMNALKSTINTLQSHNRQLSDQKSSLESKIKGIIQQVTNYQINVVKRTEDQNTKLKEQIEHCKNALEVNVKTIGKLTSNIEKLEFRNAELRKNQNELKQKCLTLDQELGRTTSRWHETERNLRQINEKEIALVLQNQKLQMKNVCLEQQIMLLHQNRQRTITLASKQQRQQTVDFVTRERYQFLETQLRTVQYQIDEIRLSNRSIRKQKDILQFENATLKQEIQNLKFTNSLNQQKIQSDIINLEQSLKIGSQVADFQSRFHQRFLFFYEQIRDLQSKTQILDRQIEIAHEKNQDYENQIQVRSLYVRELEEQKKILKLMIKCKEQQFESQYQTKFAKLQLQLQKEEIQLDRYKNAQRQLQYLKQDYERLCSQRKKQQESMQSQIKLAYQQKLDFENIAREATRQLEYHVVRSNKVQSLCKIISSLLDIVHYFHCFIIRLRQRNRKIYMPFINYYFRIHQQFDQLAIKNGVSNLEQRKNFQRNIILRKFRSCVQAVRCIIRIKRQLNPNISLASGYLRYSKKAIECNDSFRNNHSRVFELIETIFEESKDRKDNVEQHYLLSVLKFGKQNFSAKIGNFMRVQLHENYEVNKIRSLVFQKEFQNSENQEIE